MTSYDIVNAMDLSSGKVLSDEEANAIFDVLNMAQNYMTIQRALGLDEDN